MGRGGEGKASDYLEYKNEELSTFILGIAE